MLSDIGFRGFLFLSYFLAFILSIIPVGMGAGAWLRPEFVCLLSIFWVLYTPHRVSIGFIWAMGLLLDVLEGGTWGAHAFAMCIVSYIVLLSYQRLISYSLVQQMFWVLIFIGIHQVFFNWVQGITGHSVPVIPILLPTIMSALCWPLLVILLRRFCFKYL